MWRLTIDELAAHGDRVALIGVRDPLSYRTFAGRAQAVADALRVAGVRPGDRVGLISSRRANDEPVGLAGALAAGAVAVPLDAASPPLRNAAFLATSGCRALVHDEGNAPLLKTSAEQLGRIELDMDGHVLASFAGGQEHSLPPPDPALACVLHTSGSTGTPKAVPISWHAQDVFVGWMMALLAIDSRDRILRVAELTFDLAWFDHLAAWRAGATLCTMSRRDLAAAASLHAAVRRLQPSVIYGVPGLFMNLVAALGPVALLCPAPRVCCFAGEVFPPKALLELARRVPDAKLYNLFGPTETNVCSYHAVDRATLDGDAELPIGKACPYAECRIVDERGETIHGEGKGELVVRGPTAVGGEHATRDCVERRSDGLFYFCGRMDRVVKIRGFRIDPTEVECALLQCPGVGQAAVLVTEHPKFGRELVAYVAADVAIDPRPLRQRLSERLAPQMVPRTIEWLASLPRTTNGKIDYRRLANAAFE